eukprot:CAMPEP_0172680782 /NCGR_PEP_ID=MMETSP1074-20121228/17005_1 /TAXON_ID=2916 /ORGANISM="Ceratium fusus, Strain PA161109" /LENGTH=87 /DNA_ID=CAMNT_0013499169 /DNA_START=110 /DNA_END=373 /DNA_ORIENTATION=+
MFLANGRLTDGAGVVPLQPRVNASTMVEVQARQGLEVFPIFELIHADPACCLLAKVSCVIYTLHRQGRNVRISRCITLTAFLRHQGH